MRDLQFMAEIALTFFIGVTTFSIFIGNKTDVCSQAHSKSSACIFQSFFLDGGRVVPHQWICQKWVRPCLNSWESDTRPAARLSEFHHSSWQNFHPKMKNAFRRLMAAEFGRTRKSWLLSLFYPGNVPRCAPDPRAPPRYNGGSVCETRHSNPLLMSNHGVKFRGSITTVGLEIF